MRYCVELVETARTRQREFLDSAGMNSVWNALKLRRLVLSNGGTE